MQKSNDIEQYTRAVKQKEHQHYADTLIDTLLKPCVMKPLILLGFYKLATGIEPVTSLKNAVKQGGLSTSSQSVTKV